MKHLFIPVLCLGIWACDSGKSFLLGDSKTGSGSCTYSDDRGVRCFSVLDTLSDADLEIFAKCEIPNVPKGIYSSRGCPRQNAMKECETNLKNSILSVSDFDSIVIFYLGSSENYVNEYCP